MSGHSHWAGIKHKKGTVDEKRGRVFSKLLAAISAAARNEPDPDFNPRLRTAIQKANEQNVPQENIERAVKRASEPGATLEELVMEAYGPGGTAVIIEALTSNKNRTVAEVKKILSENNGKWAEPGSVTWAFETATPGEPRRPKFLQSLSDGDKRGLGTLLAALKVHDDIQLVETNANL